ncbi:ATP-dependent nuclease [Flavobacterium hydatis]|jgi:putative ATP-dependent endonuclease of OLD family|uniref:ATP-dependent endonuclease n=1 Tax=Flavobacterium hydatis TaxID=991 RepID=A0A086AIK9_FLAHY|nr:AAA family ATPase [Flavobacterium hydatis]KFF16523.1 chromosome segregation protein SMC [Flavobacterium hydatis]OXA93920.1 ATP-dependent endonuclease [Flavobacterium hydatis]
MYIARIKISNFRNFTDQTVLFNEGVNVIIGHNNAGKTNLLKALSLVLDSNASKRLETDDFNKNVEFSQLQAAPPKISISLTIKKGSHTELDDLVTVGNWLTVLDTKYEALLTYEFFLPEKDIPDYLAAMKSITDTDPIKARETAWKIIKHDFIRLFVARIWGGNLVNRTAADHESLQKFDFQFLDAIRDVEKDMLTGRNTLLREVFDFFMDYGIKNEPEVTKSKSKKLAEIKQLKQDFSLQADQLISTLHTRMKEGKDQILSYANKTGASFDAPPNFEGSMSDIEMYSVLKLIVEYESGIKIPATHNGLGYNNLIYMSLLLAKMQVNSNGDYMGSNSKVFATLAIEEPEAHLHPAMQYKFLKFLRENKKENKVRQIFVTSHSTNITSAVSLDEIICLHNDKGVTTVGYPGKVFPDDGKSKKYVQRFLDATKSDMLFAKSIVLVEGLAEQLLMSVFAQYEGTPLEENHTAVINVGGRFFEHFLYLFDTDKPFTIPKKIVCITDRDPERKELPSGRFKKCYPYEVDIDTASYAYQNNPSSGLYPEGSHKNIAFFTQDATYGKTLEYDLILSNTVSELLITDGMSNSSEILKLMKLYADKKPINEFLDILRSSDENNRIMAGISASVWPDEEKKKAIIAARYLNSVGKGENALNLSVQLIENLDEKGKAGYQDFIVPDYIKKAITYICKP